MMKDRGVADKDEICAQIDGLLRLARCPDADRERAFQLYTRVSQQPLGG
jgi:hypothetical protein